MSSVCDLGTVRNIIRGVDEPSPHTLISEMIDDAEHSQSKKIFVDINTHNKTMTFGFENAATEEQLDKMVRWNPTSVIHNSSNISTCGQGLKYYEFRFRGEQIHATKSCNVYMKSTLNSDIIYNSAKSADVSERQFAEILHKKTSYVQTSDEIEPSLEHIFSNDDGKLPFNPKTLIISKHITNESLLEWLNDDANIATLKKELINKYYEEIKCGSIIIYIKFPKDSEFSQLGHDCNTDVIGSTDKQNAHVTKIYYVEKDFDKFKKGEYVISINGRFIRIQKMGNSYARTLVDIADVSNLLLQFHFTQYTIRTPVTDNEKAFTAQFKECIVGTSLEDYCGIYLKIGDKFIDGKPIASGLTKRNLQGAKWYRGILELKNPEKTKMMLGLHGLKSEFNLSRMTSLEQIIKQCCIIYKNFCGGGDVPLYSTVEPATYCVVKTSNDKTTRTSKPGHVYLRVIGTNFYKIGKTGKSNRTGRIFDKTPADEFKKIKESFPEENIFSTNRQYHIYLSPEFDKCSSTEQIVKEYIMNLQNVICYDQKIGDDTREYFHCDDMATVLEIQNVMIEALNSD